MSPYAHILTKYAPGQTELEVRDGPHVHHVVVLAVFDHDWEQHVLVQQCTTGPIARALGMHKWEFALYFVSAGEAIRIRTFFDATRAPLVEAAAMIECWVESGCWHYGGRSNAVESDIFG